MGKKKSKPYLHTVKCVRDFGGILDFIKSGQASSCVKELDLKTFVSKCHLTVGKGRNSL